MNVSINLLKIIERPLLPIFGSWVDGAPFVIGFILLTSASYFLKRGSHVGIIRRIFQFVSAIIFFVFLHSCLCIIRQWVFSMTLVGVNDLVAFGDLSVFVLFIGLTLIVGRVFCGWVCPLGAISEALSWVAKQRMRLAKKLRLVSGYMMLTGIFILIAWLAYMVKPGVQFFSENIAAIWGMWLLSFLFIVLPWENKDRKFKKNRYISLALWIALSVIGVYITSPWCVVFSSEVDYSSVVAFSAVIVAGLVIPMGWCRYICPMGTVLSIFSKLSPTRIVNLGTCHQCGKCKSVCHMGALDYGDIDHSSCIFCGKCVGVCGYSWQSDIPQSLPESPLKQAYQSLLEETDFKGMSSSEQLPEMPPPGSKQGRKIQAAGVFSNRWMIFIACFLSVLLFQTENGFCSSAKENALMIPEDFAQKPRQDHEEVTEEVADEVEYAWPTFHGNNRRTGASNSNFRSVPSNNIWTFELEEHTWKYTKGTSVWSSSPVAAVVEGQMRIFIGAYDHNVYCIDAATGKEIWRYTTGAGITAAPVFARVEGRSMVIVASRDRAYYALDAQTGKKIWSFETYPWTYTVSESVAGSPLVTQSGGKTVIYGTMWNADKRSVRTVQRGDLFALEASSGKLLWKRKIASTPLSPPTIMDVGGRQMIFMGGEDGKVYAVNAQAVEEGGCEAGECKGEWKYTMGASITAAPVARMIHGQPIVMVGNSYGMIRSFSAIKGLELWKYRAGNVILSTPSIVETEGGLVVLFGSLDRAVHAIKAKSGLPVWQFHTDKYVVASPAVATVRDRPVVFVSSLDNYLYAVDIISGDEIMKFASGDMLWPYETRGGSTWSSPVVFGNEQSAMVLYPAHDGKLYAFKESTGGLANDRVKTDETAPSDLNAAGRQPEESSKYIFFPLFSLAIIFCACGLIFYGHLSGQCRPSKGDLHP